MLAPHHGVHRQLRAGRAAAEDLADPGVLVRLQPELGPRLLAVGVGRGEGDGVHVGHGGSGHGINLLGPAAPGRADPPGARRGDATTRENLEKAGLNYTFVIHSNLLLV